MTTDTSERGLERLICTALTGAACDPADLRQTRERPSIHSVGWVCGDPRDYDRDYCVDLAQLSAFLHDIQPDAAESLDLYGDSPTRRRFLARLQGEITKRGTVDVLRNGVRHGPAPDRPDVRHAVGGEREGEGAVRAQPLQRDAAAPIQPRRTGSLPWTCACSSTACRSRRSSSRTA